MQNEIPTSNPMGTAPVFRLMLSMGTPMMLSMLVQALYNIVDSLYVSHIVDASIVNAGDLAVTALTLAFPIQLLITALCVGTGVGVNAALSRYLGQGDRQRASRIAGNAVVLSVGYYIIIALFGLFAAKRFLMTQTNDPVALEMGMDYLQIVTVGSLPMTLYLCFEKLLQATGKTTAATLGQLIGAVTNIILDPIFIFGYLGMPKMGVAGAALATILGQFVSCIATLLLHLRRNTELDRSIKMLRPELSIIGTIYSVGAPAIAMQALVSVMTYGTNLILSGVSQWAITAYGIYYKLQSFIFMPAFGLNNASVPIIAYNYGAGKKERIRRSIRSGLIIITVLMGLGTLLLQVFCRRAVGWFAVSQETAELTVVALRVLTTGFVLAGANILLQGVCQALGNGMYSLLVTLLRMIIVALPLAWIFAQQENALQLVWFAFPIAEAVGLVVAIILTARLYKKRTANMAESR